MRLMQGLTAAMCSRSEGLVIDRGGSLRWAGSQWT